MEHRVTIELQLLHGGAPLPLAELQPQIWNMLCDYATRFTPGARRLWEDYMQWARARPETFVVEEHTLIFVLDDDDGEREPSAAVAAHWLRASLAAAYHALSSFTQDHGWLPIADPPDLAAEVWDETRPSAWLHVSDRVLQFRYDDPETLIADFGQSTAASSLDDEAREQLAEAVARHLCPCRMCEMLRPDPGFLASMLNSLDDPNPDVGSTATWYLRQTARVPIGPALAVARHGFGEPRDHAASCHDFGTKLDPEGLDEILDAITSAEDDVTRCGLLGLAAGMRIEAGSPGSSRRLFTFVAALNQDTPVREIAAEYAGYGRVADGHEDHFARALIKQIGASEEFDHNVALTLFNFYMGSPAVPAFALDAVEKLAAHESEQVQVIAAFAHTQLMTKPTR